MRHMCAVQARLHRSQDSSIEIKCPVLQAGMILTTLPHGEASFQMLVAM